MRRWWIVLDATTMGETLNDVGVYVTSEGNASDEDNADRRNGTRFPSEFSACAAAEEQAKRHPGGTYRVFMIIASYKVDGLSKETYE